MGRDRSEEERLIALRRRIADSVPGRWLSPKQIDTIARTIDKLQTTYGSPDDQDIADMYDLLKQYLPTQMRDHPYRDCAKGRDHRGRRVERDNRSNETAYDYSGDESD